MKGFTKEGKIMKKRRTVLITLAVIIVIGFTAMKFPVWRYFEIQPYIFDNRWKEVMYTGSYRDRKTAEPIIKQIDEAMSAIGYSQAELETKFGKLSFYSHAKDTVSETHDVKLLTAKFDKYGGYMWIKYSHGGTIQKGNFDCYSRLTLEKDLNGEWYVTKISEAP